MGSLHGRVVVCKAHGLIAISRKTLKGGLSLQGSAVAYGVWTACNELPNTDSVGCLSC